MCYTCNKKTKIYKHFIGLNNRAKNIISRTEAGRLSLESHININVVKFWLHLVFLPDSSIAKQCLLLSNQLFTKSWSYGTSILVEPKLVNSKLPKIKQVIIDYFKKDQMKLLWSYKKLNFYFIFKTDVSRSEYVDLIENEKHRQAVAKLRLSNHKLRIETDRYHLPKIP